MSISAVPESVSPAPIEDEAICRSPWDDKFRVLHAFAAFLKREGDELDILTFWVNWNSTEAAFLRGPSAKIRAFVEFAPQFGLEIVNHDRPIHGKWRSAHTCYREYKIAEWPAYVIHAN